MTPSGVLLLLLLQLAALLLQCEAFVSSHFPVLSSIRAADARRQSRSCQMTRKQPVPPKSGTSAQQLVGGLVKGLGNAAVATKDSLHDLFDTIDDRLQQPESSKSAPSTAADRPRDPRLSKPRTVAKQPLLQKVGSLASGAKDILYGSVEAIVETPALLRKVETRSEFERRRSAEEQARKLAARDQFTASIDGVKDALWNTVESVENTATAIAETPARVSAAISTVQQFPNQVKARADSTVASVTRAKDSLYSLADTVTGKKKKQQGAKAATFTKQQQQQQRAGDAGKLSPLLKNAAQGANQVFEAGSKTSNAVLTGAQTVGSVLNKAKAPLSIAGQVIDAVTNVAVSTVNTPKTVIVSLAKPVRRLRESQARIEAAKAEEAKIKAAQPKPEPGTADSDDKSAINKDIILDPLLKLKDSVITPLEKYKQAQARIEEAKAKNPSINISSSSSSGDSANGSNANVPSSLSGATAKIVSRWQAAQTRIEEAKAKQQQSLQSPSDVNSSSSSSSSSSSVSKWQAAQERIESAKREQAAAVAAAKAAANRAKAQQAQAELQQDLASVPQQLQQQQQQQRDYSISGSATATWSTSTASSVDDADGDSSSSDDASGVNGKAAATDTTADSGRKLASQWTPGASISIESDAP